MVRLDLPTCTRVAGCAGLAPGACALHAPSIAYWAPMYRHPCSGEGSVLPAWTLLTASIEGGNAPIAQLKGQ